VTETPRPIDNEAACSDAVESFLDAVAERDADMRAFVQVDSTRLRAEAAEKDGLPLGARGPLHGRLVAVKEVFDVAGYTCAWGTPIHSDRIPTTDADAVRLLRNAGAIIAGITVSTEYAMSRVGPTVNPWDPARTPGASSQGSAAAVGAGLVPLALGSQTIGSVIRPAAYCGCVGVKPTWGVIDVSGSMPLAAPIDHVGYLASSTDLARTVLALLAPRLDSAVRPDRVIAIQPWYDAETDADVIAAVASAVEVLGATGLTIEQAELPAWITQSEAQVLDTILAHGMARNHAIDYDRAADRMTERIRDYIVRGRALPESAYTAALRDRERIADSLDELLGDGVALIPATTGIAPLLREGTGSRAPQRLWSLAGCPATTVPFGLAAGMPLGVQIVAARGHDHAVLAAAAQLQAAAAQPD
jgi:Asp-tRNA(Asn)/Glu-tRNA(Gln) amidotransferase A subunit family amidase